MCSSVENHPTLTSKLLKTLFPPSPDTQLYVFVAPIILSAWHAGLHVTRSYRKHLGLGLALALLATSVGLALHATLAHDVWLQYFGEGNFYYYYVKPWIRAPPYILGMILGLILHHMITDEAGTKIMAKLKNAKVLPTWACCIALTTSLGIMCALVFPIASYFDTDHEVPPITTTHSAGWTRSETIAYNTLRFTAWGVALFLMMLPVVLGRLPLITEILGGHVWAPFAKLTFGAYLIHMLYPQALLTSIDNSSPYYNTSLTLNMWLVFAVGSYFWSLVLYLLVEAPAQGLLKVLMGSLRGGGREKIKRKLTGVEDPRETEVKSKVFSPRSLP